MWTTDLDFLEPKPEDQIKFTHPSAGITYPYVSAGRRDAFYMKVFNMTYAEKKQEEEAEYFDLDNGKKVYMKKKPEVTDTIQ